MKTACELCPKATAALHTFGEPLLLLLIRFQVGLFFWRSGKLKLDTYLSGNWQDTVSLFSDIHPVPGLPAALAAPMSVASEVGLSVLLILGLLSRGVALGLLGVCGVIYITHQANYDNLGDFIEAPWLVLLLLVVLVRGAGAVSLDRVLGVFCTKEPHPNAPSEAE